MISAIKNFVKGNKIFLGVAITLLLSLAFVSNKYIDTLEQVSVLKADKQELASVIENNEQRILRYQKDIEDLETVLDNRETNETIVEEKVVEKIKVVKEYVEVSPEFGRCYDVLLPPELRVTTSDSDQD